jgi:hypothetical protein
VARSIETRRGSSLHEAAFSLVFCAYVHITTPFGPTKKFNVHSGKDFHGISFETIIEIAKQSDPLIVRVSTTSDGLITCASQALKDLFGKAIDPSRNFSHVTIYTEHIDKIRALAKEIRADKSVARATKKPAEPKADLKTRKDIV